MKRYAPKFGCLLVACIAIAVTLFAYKYDPWIFTWRYNPKTEYAERFNEASYSRITVGMNRSDVLAALGPPIRSFTEENFAFLVYSDIGDYTSRWEKAYHQRWIAVGKNDKVVYVFKRKITTEDNPCYPITEEKIDSDGVGRHHVTARFRNQ